MTRVPPPWQAPRGVDGGLWDYVRSERLADEDDDYFANDALVRSDLALVRRRFETPAPLVDLGCGTGRMALDFAARGFSAVAVDLSMPMLRTVRQRALDAGVPVAALRANLCELGCLSDGQFSYALSMYSTLGMIRGAANRARALAECRRVLKPAGRLALHAHNHWHGVTVRGRRLRTAREALGRIITGRSQDAPPMTYRGIPNVRVHRFAWRELTAALRAASFAIDEVVSLDPVSAAPIAWPNVAHGIRAGGWIVFARAV